MGFTLGSIMEIYQYFDCVKKLENCMCGVLFGLGFFWSVDCCVRVFCLGFGFLLLVGLGRLFMV